MAKRGRGITETDIAINKVLGTSIGPPPPERKPRKTVKRLAEMLAAATYPATRNRPEIPVDSNGYLTEGATFDDLVEWVSSQTLTEAEEFESALVVVSESYEDDLEEAVMASPKEDKPSERIPHPEDLPGQTGEGIKTGEELSVPFNEADKPKDDEEGDETVEEATTSAGITPHVTVSTDGKRSRDNYRLEEREEMRSTLRELWGDVEEGCGSKHKKGKLPKGVLARVYYKKASRYDRKNRNQRIYESKYAKKALEELDEMAKGGRAFVLESHPKRNAKGRPRATGSRDVAGLIRLAEYNEAERVGGIVIDVINTEAGRDSAAILEAGGDLPVSSRAKGATRIATYYEGADGPIGVKPGRMGLRRLVESRKAAAITVVGPYRYEAYDFVAGRQSDPGALSTHIISEAEEASIEESETMNLEEFKAEHGEAYVAMLEEAVATAKRAVLEELKVSVESEEDVEEALSLIGQTMDQSGMLVEAIEEANEKIATLEEALEGADPIEEAEEPEVDPEKQALEERLAELEAKNHAHEMKNLFESLLEESAIGPYRTFVEALVLGASPKDDEALNQLFESAETLVTGIASTARRMARKNVRAVGVGRGRAERSVEKEAQLSELRESVGDVEDADAYDGFYQG